MDADDLLVDGSQGLVGESKLGRKVASEVVEYSVGTGHQAMEYLLSIVRLQIERDAALVTVEGLMEHAVTWRKRVVGMADMPPDIATLAGVLDLDDLGTQVGQLQCAKGSGTILLDGYDPYAFQRKGHVMGSRFVN